MITIKEEVKNLKSELDRLEKKIRDNSWDDAFTGPSMAHQDYMSCLYKKRDELKKSFNDAIAKL